MFHNLADSETLIHNNDNNPLKFYESLWLPPLGTIIVFLYFEEKLLEELEKIISHYSSLLTSV